VVGVALEFCKCADVGWQKSGWKKNKFGVGKVLEFCGLVLNQFCFEKLSNWTPKYPTAGFFVINRAKKLHFKPFCFLQINLAA